MHKDRRLQKLEKVKPYIFKDVVTSPAATGGIGNNHNTHDPPDITSLLTSQDTANGSPTKPLSSTVRSKTSVSYGKK